MESQFSRTELLIGKDKVCKLNDANVVIFGIGGVGSFVVEALARAGIQKFILIDNDMVSITNINRQIIATHSTIGRYKVDVMKERILDINPDATIETFKEFYLPGAELDIFNRKIDYVIDCIDTITAKIDIVKKCKALDIPLISSMGTGNKLDPTKFEITDIKKTSVCPVAKIMRKELKKNNINSLKVIYSKEKPIKVQESEDGKRIPGSISFVPSVAGLMIASEVIKDLSF